MISKSKQIDALIIAGNRLFDEHASECKGDNCQLLREWLMAKGHSPELAGAMVFERLVKAKRTAR